jgi:hypothetical protein
MKAKLGDPFPIYVKYHDPISMQTNAAPTLRPANTRRSPALRVGKGLKRSGIHHYALQRKFMRQRYISCVGLWSR